MKFGRIMIVLGILATLGLVATAVQGYAGVHGRAGLKEHVLLGLVALLLFVLAHCWILVYLVGIDRLLRPLARAAGRDDVVEPPLRSFRSRTLPLLLAAVFGGIAVFTLGSEAYSGRMSPSVHGVLIWVTVALQAGAVAVEWRALAASERALERLRS